MIMALALFLVTQGCRPSQITILAAYLGQQKVLRNMQKEFQSKHPNMFGYTSGDCESFQIQTIDMYQGDENDFVLVSLTRGNKMASIGFMKMLNRRCVAQSRAKCGMYFVGNLETYHESEGRASVWQPLLAGMSGSGCVGRSLVVQCRKHA